MTTASATMNSSEQFTKENFDRLQDEVNELRSQRIKDQTKINIQQEKILILQNMLLDEYRAEHAPSYLRVVR